MQSFDRCLQSLNSLPSSLDGHPSSPNGCLPSLNACLPPLDSASATERTAQMSYCASDANQRRTAIRRRTVVIAFMSLPLACSTGPTGTAGSGTAGVPTVSATGLSATVGSTTDAAASLSSSGGATSFTSSATSDTSGSSSGTGGNAGGTNGTMGTSTSGGGTTSGGPVDAGLDAGPCDFDRTLLDNRVACYATELEAEVRGRYAEILKLDAGGKWVCPLPDSGFDAFATYQFVQDGFADLWLLDGGSSASDGGWPDVAEQIRCTLSYEDLSDGGTRGVVPSAIGGAFSLNDNGVEFTLLPLAGALELGSPALLAELFTDGGPSSILPQLEAALAAVERRETSTPSDTIAPACESYTNICAVTTAELTALGGFLADAGPAAADRSAGAAALMLGTELLGRWLSYTQTYGIREFVSPTYSEVDIESAGMGLRFAPTPAIAASFHDLLDLFFVSEAANAMAAQGELAGPYSRDYDFFGGETDIIRSLYLSGLYLQTPAGAYAGVGSAFAPIAFETYQPDAGFLALAFESPRTVLSTWSVDGGPTTVGRQVYVTNDFWVGGTSADFAIEDNDNQNIPISAGLSQNPTLVTVLPDYLDHPASRAASSGKVTHPLVRPVVVQAGAQLLVTVNGDPQDPGYGPSYPLVKFTTDVLFPFLPADEPDAGLVLLNGAPFDIGAGAQLSLSTPQTLVFQVGSGLLAVSVLTAAGVECPVGGTFVAQADAGATISAFYPNGDAGGQVLGRLAIDQLPASRLAAFGDAGVPAGCFARAAVLIAGESCAGPTCAASFAVQQAQAAATFHEIWDAGSGDWSVSVVVPEDAGLSTLLIHRNLSNGTPLAQTVNGVTPIFPPQSVNGVSLP